MKKKLIYKILKNNKNWPFLILIILVLLTYRVWLFSFSIITAGDWWYFFRVSTIAHFLSYLYIWHSHTNIGGVTLDVGQAPTYLLNGIYAKYLNLDYQYIERLVHFYPIIIFTPLSICLLLGKYFKNRIAILVGAVFYTFNTYFLLLDTGHITLAAAFAFAPAIIYYFDNILLSSFKTRDVIITAIISLVCLGYEPRAFYIVAWILFFYFLYHLIINFKLYLQNWRKLLRLFFLFVVLILAFNLYWIIGLLPTGSLSSNELFSRGLFGDLFWRLPNALTVYHPFWSGGVMVPFKVYPIPLYAWLAPILAFVGLALKAKNPKVIFYGILAVMGIFLAKQSSEPAGFVYLWLYKNVPGFNAFREASKFYYVIALSYAVLITAAVDWFLEQKYKLKWQRIARSGVIVLIIIIFAINIKPLVTGEIRTLFVARNIPEDYKIVASKVESQPEYFRIMWVPTILRWSVYDNKHPRLGLVDVMSPDWAELSNFNDDWPLYPIKNQTINFLDQPFSAQLFDIASVKYVVVASEDNQDDHDMFIDYGPRQYFIEELDRISYLKRVDFGTSDLVVYENQNYHPQVYLTQEKDTILTRIPYQKIDSEYDTPTEHRFWLRGVKNDFYVNFSEKFNPNWKIYPGQVSSWTALTSKNYLDDKNHRESDADFNSFFVDINDLKSKLPADSIKQNSDGSYDFRVTLYFKPQSYYHIGLMVSGGAVLLSIIYLIFSWLMSKKRLEDEKKIAK